MQNDEKETIRQVVRERYGNIAKAASRIAFLSNTVLGGMEDPPLSD